MRFKSVLFLMSLSLFVNSYTARAFDVDLIKCDGVLGAVQCLGLVVVFGVSKGYESAKDVVTRPFENWEKKRNFEADLKDPSKCYVTVLALRDRGVLTRKNGEPFTDDQAKEACGKGENTSAADIMKTAEIEEKNRRAHDEAVQACLKRMYESKGLSESEAKAPCTSEDDAPNH